MSQKDFLELLKLSCEISYDLMQAIRGSHERLSFRLELFSNTLSLNSDDEEFISSRALSPSIVRDRLERNVLDESDSHRWRDDSDMRTGSTKDDRTALLRLALGNGIDQRLSGLLHWVHHSQRGLVLDMRASLLADIGQIESELGRFQSAIEYFQKAVKIYESLNLAGGDRRAEYLCLAALGTALCRAEMYEEGIYYLNTSIKKEIEHVGQHHYNLASKYFSAGVCRFNEFMRNSLSKMEYSELLIKSVNNSSQYFELAVLIFQKNLDIPGSFGNLPNLVRAYKRKISDIVKISDIR